MICGSSYPKGELQTSATKKVSGLGGREASRRAIRQSYGCTCGGDRVRGRILPAKTDHILKGIERFTGVAFTSCPWSALDDEIVRQCVRLHNYHEKGNLAAVLTRYDSERLWQAWDMWLAIDNRVQSARAKEEIERVKRGNRRGK